MARKAEVIFVGDASSIVRASAESKAAIDSINSSADKSSSSLGGMSTKMKLLGGAVTVAAAALPAVAGGIAAISGAAVGIGAVTAGVAVLAAGFTELDKSNKTFAAGVKTALPQLKGLLAQGVQPLLAPAMQVLKQLPAMIKQVEPALKSLFSGAATLIQPLANGLVSIAKVALPELGAILKASSGLVKPLTDGFNDLVKVLGPVLTQTLKAMQPIMAPLLKSIGGLVAGLLTGINVMLKALGPAIGPLSKIFTQIGATIGNVFSALAPAIGPSLTVLSDLLTLVSDLLVPIGKVAGSLATALIPFFTEFAKIITNLIPVLMPFVKTILLSLGNALTQIAPLLGKVVDTLMHDLAPLLPVLVKLFAQLVNAGVQVFVKALVQLTPVLVKLINAVIPPLIPSLKALTPLISKLATLFGNVLILAVKALIPILNGVVTAIGFVIRAVSEIDQKAGPALKSVEGAFSSAWNAVKNTTESVWGGIKSWLVGAWDDITGTISTFASDVESGVIGAFDGAANAVIGFVDDIIKAINLIPGVPNIGLISKVGSSSSSGPAAPGGSGGFATGGKIDRPMFMVGEEAPRHPEYVVATNPAYRKRNLGLWASAGKELGVPGFAQGGVPVTGRLSGNSQGSVDPSKISAFGNVGSAISSFVGKLPGVGGLPGWIQGMGSSVLGDVTGWIKSKVSSVFKSVTSALGFGHESGGGAPTANEALGHKMMLQAGWGNDQWPDLLKLWTQESGWNTTAFNVPGDYGAAYGIPQADPGTKMASAGADWKTNPATQIAWGLNYIKGSYGSPAAAWAQEVGSGFKGYAQGGTPGLADDQTKINQAFSFLNSKMGPSGDYNALGEKINFYPSMWQTSNSLFGSGASSFINTTDAAGNSIAPFINTAGLNLTTGQENQELGWYGTQIEDIQESIPVASKIVPVIQDAIKRLTKQIAVVKAAVKMRIDSIVSQINTNLQAIKALQDKIKKAQNRKEPFPSAKNKSQRAANDAFKQNIHDQIYGKDGTGGWQGQIGSLESQNRKLGGTETTVGTGGQIGVANKSLSAQVAAIQKQITSMKSNLSNVTGSGSFSPLTLQGITGMGGDLGPALLQQASLQAELASISPSSISAALAAAQASSTGSSGTGTTAAAPTSFVGPTTTQELADLLNGMPALAPGGGRAAGGPVRPGYVYRVGEQGPEDVAFGASGHVLTAAQTRAGGSGMHIEHAYFTGATAAKATVDRLAYRAAIGVA